ncbi:hypothetical protein PVAP13_6NG289360 [Panicum virgatum]|uniref:Uncharacterized protein n=1 Tax=Panicum virgatum TaxID=38727 RepID=A0A8T0R1T0_PANVG|nr:hypothetical protein PVAP13_6NG289360 [Panicum virgatum]
MPISHNDQLLELVHNNSTIRNLKYEPDWRMEYNDNKQVEGGMRKEMFFAPKVVRGP